MSRNERWTLVGIFATAMLILTTVGALAVAEAQAPVGPPRPAAPPAEVAPVFTTLLSQLFSVSVVNAHQDADTGVNTMVYDSNGWRHTVYLTSQADGATVLTIYKEPVPRSTP